MPERFQRWCGICFRWREELVGRCASCGNAYMTGAPLPLPSRETNLPKETPDA